jgi:hypothetical protein
MRGPRALASAPGTRQIGRVHPPLPPYAVAPPAFPFPALATRAGNAALGGERETLMAVFVAARLVRDALDAAGEAVPPSLRAARARGARAWLGALAVPAGVRGPVGKLIDASADGDPAGMRTPLGSVIAVTAPHLDPASRSELERLAQALVP